MTAAAVRGARAAAALASAFGALGSAAASAAASPGSDTTLALGVTFTPRFAEPLDRAPVVGELDLHVRDDGKIVGFFRRESDRVQVPLTGGRTSDDRTFFDVGSGMQDFHVEGRLDDANGHVSGLTGTARIGSEQYDVSAAPCRDARGAVSILCQ